MNSLMSYGSDDNSDDSGDEKFPEIPGHDRMSNSKNYRKPGCQEDNYEEVGMDMSEDSNDSVPSPPNSNQKKQLEVKNNLDFQNKDARSFHARRSRDSPPNRTTSSERRSNSKSPKYKRDDERRNSRSEDRSRNEDRYGRNRRDDRKDSRDEDRSRDRNYKDDERTRDRDKFRDDRRDRRDDRSNRDDRYRRDKDRRRSRSRDRRRSRSPRRSRTPRRSRSGSRDRGPSKSFKRDRASNRMDRLDKLGIEFKPDNYPASALQGAQAGSGSGDRFFMPGITGRFRDQIEKRKQLWQKGKEQDSVPVTTVTGFINGTPMAGSKAAKVYEATTFADDKTSNKFKRLMGIRDTGPANLPTKSNDVLKKQEEMFSSMEAQYEVARTATHTMRGVGLGFGSFQR